MFKLLSRSDIRKMEVIESPVKFEMLILVDGKIVEINNESVNHVFNATKGLPTEFVNEMLKNYTRISNKSVFKEIKDCMISLNRNLMVKYSDNILTEVVFIVKISTYGEYTLHEGVVVLDSKFSDIVSGLEITYGDIINDVV